VKPEEAIFVLSVQHTGTWFVVDFLRDHPDVGFFSEYQHLLRNNPRLYAAYEKCANSLRGPNGEFVWSKPRPESSDYDARLLGGFVDATLESLTSGTRVLLQQHTQSPRRRLTGVCGGNMCARAFSKLFRTVIPIRDPLLSLLSVYSRDPKLRGANIVDDFEFVVESLSSSCFFLPVDLYSDFRNRSVLLERLLKFVGLSRTAHVYEVAERWTPKNTKGEYEMKRWYREGSLLKIAGVIPKEVEYLKSRECVLRPFLESLGYEGLLWWS
jgi:hypothetical protein